MDKYDKRDSKTNRNFRKQIVKNVMLTGSSRNFRKNWTSAGHHYLQKRMTSAVIGTCHEKKRPEQLWFGHRKDRDLKTEDQGRSG